MIYLICSSAIINFKKRELGFIYKIGYCGEDSKKARFNAYFTENPTIKVLYSIPGGTEQDERNLHYHFRDFKKPYGNEWFSYSPEILNFFKSHTTKESLEELSEFLSTRKRAERRAEAIKWLNSYNRIYKPKSPEDVLKFEDLKFSLLSSNEDPEKYFQSILDIDSYKDLVLEKSKVYPETPEYKEFLSYGKFIDRMKFLCDQEGLLSAPEYDSLLSLVSGDYENYIRSLGVSEIRAIGYQKSKIIKIFKKKISDSSIENNITNKIYQEFQVGGKYLKSDIKSILKKIYESLGYSKTPKAIDLKGYFEISTYQVTNKETGKRDSGFELGRRLRKKD